MALEIYVKVLLQSLQDLLISESLHGVPASLAQLDACPTGDQEVAGSTSAEVGNILS